MIESALPLAADAAAESRRKGATYPPPGTEPGAGGGYGYATARPEPLVPPAWKAFRSPSESPKGVATAEGRTTRDRADEDDVAQLAGALQAARPAHRAYLAELRLGDTEPAEDWSTWYAEYLLGER